MSIALRAHIALGLKNFSRTDLILKKGTSLFYALETNSLPGLTETSILPSAAMTYGISFAQLCEKMLH
jgi:D-alanine-D-alanine ligase